MVTIQNCGFVEFLEYNPFVWVPESKEEMVHFVYWQTPVLCHTTCPKAFCSKESWVVVYGLLMEQRKLEIRVKVDWILCLSYRPKDWLHDSFYLALGGQIQPLCNMSALSPSPACHDNTLPSAYNFR